MMDLSINELAVRYGLGLQKKKELTWLVSDFLIKVNNPSAKVQTKFPKIKKSELENIEEDLNC